MFLKHDMLDTKRCCATLHTNAYTLRSEALATGRQVWGKNHPAMHSCEVSGLQANQDSRRAYPRAPSLTPPPTWRCVDFGVQGRSPRCGCRCPTEGICDETSGQRESNILRLKKASPWFRTAALVVQLHTPVLDMMVARGDGQIKVCRPIELDES